MLHAILKLIQAILSHHCNCYIIQQSVTDGLGTRPTPMAIEHSKEHAFRLKMKEKSELHFTMILRKLRIEEKQRDEHTDKGKMMHTCKQVAALQRSSLGVLAASWLLSNFLTALSALPSNSGTLTV